MLDSRIEKQNEIDILYLCEKYDLEYWSYQNEVFDDREFLDNSHLNRTGARRYSRMLNQQLVTISSYRKY